MGIIQTSSTGQQLQHTHGSCKNTYTLGITRQYLSVQAKGSNTTFTGERQQQSSGGENEPGWKGKVGCQPSVQTEYKASKEYHTISNLLYVLLYVLHMLLIQICIRQV